MPDETGTRQPSFSRPYQEWIRAIKSLDAEAWDTLVRFFADDLRADIQISLQKKQMPLTLVDDIAQETWITAIRKIGEFDWEDDDKFYHWLRVISLNHIHNARRRYSREQSLDDFEGGEAELDEFRNYFSLRYPQVEDVVIERERMRALVLAMHALKPEDHEIFVLWLMGETPRKLALLYNRKPRSISTMLVRAKDKILASLQPPDRDT